MVGLVKGFATALLRARARRLLLALPIVIVAFLAASGADAWGMTGTEAAGPGEPATEPVSSTLPTSPPAETSGAPVSAESTPPAEGESKPPEPPPTEQPAKPPESPPPPEVVTPPPPPETPAPPPETASPPPPPAETPPVEVPASGHESRPPATSEEPAPAEPSGGTPKHDEAGAGADATPEAAGAALIPSGSALGAAGTAQTPVASAPMATGSPAPSTLGPVASPGSIEVLATRRIARDALLKAFPAVVESTYVVVGAGSTFAAPTITPVLALDASSPATRDARTRGVAHQPSIEHELPPAFPLGEGGGSSGGAAAGGGGSGSSSSSASVLVAPLLRAAPGAVRLLPIAQPTWRTSFFVLIPERPD
jgi:hypothetical protein